MRVQEAPVVNVREAKQNEADAIRGLIEASMLELEPGLIHSIIASRTPGTVLVAVDSEDSPILGAIVVDGRRIEAIAVRPNRRDQGIGTALLTNAAEQTENELIATFDPSVWPFYERLGFEVESIEEDSRVRATFSKEWLC